MREAEERHLEVARTARYWVQGDPDAPRGTWFVLHGYKQLARRFLRRFEPLSREGVRVVAPEGLSRFYADEAPGRHGPGSVVGATWMTREDREHEIHDYVRYLDALAAAEAGPTGPDVVLGFSQGVATAARWTALGRTRPRRLLVWGDFLPPDLPAGEAGRAWLGLEVVRVRGEGDRIFADAARIEAEEAWLAGAGVSSPVVRYPGGHDIHQPTLRALAAPR